MPENGDYLKYIQSLENVFVLTNVTNLLASTLEGIACDLYIHSNVLKSIEVFNNSFILRRNEISQLTDANIENIFQLAVCALGSKRTSELRMILNREDISKKTSSDDWEQIVRGDVVESFLFLCRKKGWSDINAAVRSIQSLRELQKKFEQSYLDRLKDSSFPEKIQKIGFLISLFNLAKIVEITGTYLISANPQNPLIQIKKFYDNAILAIENNTDFEKEHFIDMIYIGCELLIKNSIWYSTGTLGKNVRDFVKALTEEEREKPFIELFPSQQEAMKSILFDTAKTAITLQMPTSAGKTLLAEFSIVQSFALNPDDTIIYVVPTRALVNQVTQQLRDDLFPLGLIVESAVPVFELDPTESELLQKKCNVLVSTPEKIELLVRENHPIVKEISLIVADEIHNISDTKRGGTLELFLSTILRERANVRFILMSPFIKNSDDLAFWLGRERGAKIAVDWKPSERITAAVIAIGKGKNKRLNLHTLPSLYNSDVQEEIDILIDGEIIDFKKNTKEIISLSTALSLVDEGCVLVLTNGRKRAEKEAKELMRYRPELRSNKLLDLTIKYLEDELGENHVLPIMVKKGIAFHHAGLSLDTRYLVEKLIKKEIVNIVFATTTLAQGVNFPIKTVIVEEISRFDKELYTWKEIPYSEFWNIAGRAGRALEDDIGLVLFSSRDEEDIQTYKDYLKNSDIEILSAIYSELKILTEISDRFNRDFVLNHPALGRFFQYLLHAVSISDYETVSSGIRDVLLSSLAYYQMNKESPNEARKLIDVAINYLEQIQGKNKGIIKLIDGTGFCSMSFDYLWTQRDNFSDVTIWQGDSLFSKENDVLEKMVQTIAGVPEINLTRIGGGPIGIKTISNVIKDWVNGYSIEEIADKHFASIKDKDNRITTTSGYIHHTLVSQVAWGMSALLKVSLFGKLDVDWKEIGHIPALMYYGVSSKEAATMRMLGVPRGSAEEIGEKYKVRFSDKSPTFQEIREWLKNVDAGAWKGKRAKLSGDEAKEIWKILNSM